MIVIERIQRDRRYKVSGSRDREINRMDIDREGSMYCRDKKLLSH